MGTTKPFEVGCQIWHDEFGIGVIIKIYNDGICLVEFDKFWASQKRMLPDKLCKATMAHEVFNKYCIGVTNMSVFELLKFQKDVVALKHRAGEDDTGEILDILKYKDGSYLGLIPSFWGTMMSVVKDPILVS